MSSDDDRWMDWDAGPVARPYTVTGGRTRPRGERYFDLVDVVARTGQPAESLTEVTNPGAQGPGHRPATAQAGARRPPGPVTATGRSLPPGAPQER